MNCGMGVVKDDVVCGFVVINMIFGLLEIIVFVVIVGSSGVVIIGVKVVVCVGVNVVEVGSKFVVLKKAVNSFD